MYRLLLVLFVSVAFIKTGFSQVAIVNPVFSKTTHNELKIEKIEFFPDETILYFFIYADKGSFCVDTSFHIIGKTDNKTYKLLKIEGMKTCPESYNFEKNSVRFRLHFQPVDIKNDYIDLIEDCEDFCVKINNILINEVISKIEHSYNRAKRDYSQRKYNKAIGEAIHVLPIIQDTTGLRYGQILLIIADSYLSLKDFDNAEFWYNKILASDLADSLKTGIISEPFANFKHKACMGLGSVYEYKNDWAKSMEWLNVGKSFPFQTYSNTHRLKHLVRMMEWYVFLYEKMEMYEAAVHENLTFIVTYFSSGIREAQYLKANQRLVDLVCTHFDNSLFIAQLDSALENMAIKQLNDIIICEFFFLNQKYEIKVLENHRDLLTDETYRFISGSQINAKDMDYFMKLVKSQLFYSRIQIMNGLNLEWKDNLICYKDEPYTGKFAEFWNNGNKRTEGELKDGVFNGSFTFYYKNGLVHKTGEKKNGVKNGVWKTYYENGAIESEGEYLNGLMTGKWVHWYPSGKQNEQLEISEGDWVGMIVNALLDDDIPLQKMTEIYYADDVEHGSFIIWFKNGQKYREGYCEHGKRVDKWTEWNEDGVVVKKAYYKKGVLIKGDCFDKK